jgi:peptide deformylase
MTIEPNAQLTFDLDGWLGALSDLPPIVQVGANVLRGRAREVPLSVLGTPAFERLVEIMVEVMRRAPGVGLAAPQIGIPWRVFVAEDPERVDPDADDERRAELREAREARGRVALPLTCWINPTLKPAGKGDALFFEGCLSMRGYAAIVPRSKAVTVRGFDRRGQAVEARYTGWPARIMQHETDHLWGALYVDRMLSRSLTGEADLQRLSKLPVSDAMAELGVRWPETKAR